MTQAELNALVGERFRLLGERARDPKHPMHHKIKWDPVTGRPVMPDDDEELCGLILAALDEPTAN